MEIRYSKQAIKFLQKQDKPTRLRIDAAINKLPIGDVKKLQGSIYYRLRVGDFRIIFDRNGNIIHILKIDSRGDSYK